MCSHENKGSHETNSSKECCALILTNSPQAHPYGGEAYLEVLDATAPLGGQGVQYSAMPPAKRFCEMHLLSGGVRRHDRIWHCSVHFFASRFFIYTTHILHNFLSF